MDAYYLWLGIPPQERPPNYYQLLGLQLFESSPELISLAAAQRTGWVQSHQAEDYLLVQRIVNELGMARSCLLDSQAKGTYDHQLHYYLAMKAAATAAGVVPAPNVSPSAAPVWPMAPVTSMFPPPGAIPAGAYGPQTVSPQETLPAQSAASPTPLAQFASPSPAGPTVAAGFTRTRFRGKDKESSSHFFRLIAIAVSVALSVVAICYLSGTISLARRSPEEQIEPEPVKSPAAQEHEESDEGPPTDAGTLSEMLAAARGALAARNLESARRYIQSAQKAARSPAEKAEADRLRVLSGWVENFWQVVRAEVEHLKPGDELALGDTYAIVVELGEGRLVLRNGGVNRRYVVGELPGRLAVAVAEHKLPDNSARTDICVGSFLAVDRWGNRAEARTRLERAGPPGRALLPEVDLASAVEAVPEAPVVPPSETAKVDTSWEGLPRNTPAVKGANLLGSNVAGPKEKLPEPTVDSQAKAEIEIDALLAEEIRGARDTKGREALAKKFSDMALKTADDPVVRFVLFRKAAETLAKLGDPDEIERCVSTVEKFYKIDSLEMRARLFWAAYRSEKAVAYRDALVRRTVPLVDEALKAGNYHAADYALRVAIAGARAVKDYREAGRLEKLADTVKAKLPR